MIKNLDGVHNLYKEKSETPLETIERFVEAHPEYKGVKMTYAGRLDPMAEGVLIVLSGEKNKQRDEYTSLDKDYEFQFVLGIETDTHDVLGKITSTHDLRALSNRDIEKALKKYTGKFTQKYPAYSSKIVDGTPLYLSARRGKIKNINLPEHEVEVKKIELVDSREITKEDFRKQIKKDINAVSGDFRQKEILQIWEKYFETSPARLAVYKAKVTSSSGFYVRQLVSDIGRDLRMGAIAVSILRTRVGMYPIS